MRPSAVPIVREVEASPELRAISTAVALRDVRHAYDGRYALCGVTMDIREGEIFGLIGPNGAGKTTLLSIVSTRTRPTHGDAWVYGKHVVRDVDAARRLLNVAPQQEALYPTLTGAENARFFTELYGVPRRDRARRVRDVLDMVGLGSHRDDRVATYSSGMRRRLNLGCALVSGPRLLLLDEPTAGVDPHSRVCVFDAVRALRAAGATIVYTTHYLEEAEDLCDRIAILDAGRIVASGTLPELLALSGAAEVIRLRVLHPPDTLAPLQAAEGVQRVEAVGNEICVFTTRAQLVLPRVYGALARPGQAVLQTRARPVTLADVFLALTGKELRD